MRVIKRKRRTTTYTESPLHVRYRSLRVIERKTRTATDTESPVGSELLTSSLDRAENKRSQVKKNPSAGLRRA